MRQPFEKVYTPSEQNAAVYELLYQEQKRLANLLAKNHTSTMKPTIQKDTPFGLMHFAVPMQITIGFAAISTRMLTVTRSGKM